MCIFCRRPTKFERSRRNEVISLTVGGREARWLPWVVQYEEVGAVETRTAGGGEVAWWWRGGQVVERLVVQRSVKERRGAW